MRAIAASVTVSLCLMLCADASPSQAQSREHACDTLAGSPTDDNRVGEGVPFDTLVPEPAIAACEQAVEEFPNVPRFRFQLARALSRVQRYQEAISYYEPLANSGYPAATHNLGALYLPRAGAPGNVKRAISLMETAATQGFVLSQVQLGYFYFTGSHVEKDLQVAAEWYARAAARGHAGAQVSLGDMYAKGLGVTRDDAAAVKLYRSAADSGNAFAMAQVARMHENGRGVPADKLKAYLWSRLASDAGLPGALIDLGRLAQEQLAVAPARTESDSFGSSTDNIAQNLSDDERISADDFLSQYRELARATVNRSAQQRVADAINWFEKAVQKGFSDTHLLLGDLNLAVLRDQFEPVLRRGNERWRQHYSAVQEPARPSDDDDIVIEPRGDSVSFVVSDPVGRRVFAGALNRGQQYRPPRGRKDLILWVNSIRSSDDLKIRLGRKIIKLPRKKGPFGLRLDRAALERGSGLFEGAAEDDRIRPARLPTATLRGSRIEIEALTTSNIFVHGEDYLIGFEEAFLQDGARFRVPNIKGLTLELQPRWHPDGLQTSSVAIKVDGKRILELSAPAECLTTLRLDPELLRDARRLDAGPHACPWKEEDTATAHVVHAKHGTLGDMRRLPDTYKQRDPLRLRNPITSFRLALGGRWDESLTLGRRALLQDLHEFGPNSFETISTRLEVCDLEILLRNTPAARACLDTAIETLNGIGGMSDDMRINIYGKFSSLLWSLGRYAEAEQFMSRAQALRARANRQTLPGAGELFLLSEGAGYLDEAIAYILQILQVDYSQNSDRGQAVFAGTSQHTLVRLLELLQRTGRRDQFDRLLPFAHYMSKRYLGKQAAAEPLQHPLDLTQLEPAWGPVDRSNTIAANMGSLAQVYAWMDRHAEALPLLEQRARTLRNIYGEASPEASAALASVANTYRMLGTNDRARTVAREAFVSGNRFVESRGVHHDASISAVATLRPAGVALLESLHAIYSRNDSEAASAAEEAFEVAQRLNNSAAALALQSHSARLSQSDPKLRAFLRRRQDLIAELAQRDATLIAFMSSKAAARDRAQEELLRGKVRDTERLFREHESARPEAFQNLEEMERARTVAYRDLGHLLDADEAVVTFVAAERATFVFVATREKLQWHRAELTADRLNRFVQTLRCGLDGTQWEGQNRTRHCTELTDAAPRVGLLPFDRHVAHELYRLLLGPFEELLGRKHLLMALSGALTSLPPQVLVTEPATTAVPTSVSAYQDTAWIARRHAITVVPAIASVSSVRGNRSVATMAPRPTSYLGLGNPRLAGTPKCRRTPVASRCPGDAQEEAAVTQPRIRISNAVPTQKYYQGTLADTSAVRKLCPLDDTAQELICIAKQLGGKSNKLVLGRAFTETAIKRTRLEQFRIIHFATHGLLADEVQRFGGALAEPALVMTPPTSATADDDGLLTASEIMQLNLDADWVVLSACNTAGGNRIGAEALSGLARAFFQAGTRTLLVSHWQVESSATVMLTTRTFSEMAHPGVDPAQALRRSMLAMIDDQRSPQLAHPQYWAPFIVAGEGRPIR